MESEKSSLKGIPFGLTSKLIVLVVIAMLLAGGMIGAFAFVKGRAALRERILAGSLKTAVLAARFAAQYLIHLQEDARELALNPLIVRAVTTRSYGEAQAELIRFLRMNRHFDSVGILDAQGIVRVSGVADNPSLGKSSADRDWFRQAMATGKSFLGVPVKSRATGRPSLPYGIPIPDGQGKPCGVLTVGIAPADLERTIVDIGVGPQAQAQLIDLREGGIILADADPRRILTHISDKNDAFRPLASGRSGTAEAENSAGEAILAAFAPVPGSPWGVLITVPHRSAFASLDILTVQLPLLAFVTVLLTALISSLLARRITRPLVSLRDATSALAAGDLARRVQTKPKVHNLRAPSPGLLRNDEIAEIAVVFDQMAESLQAEQTALRRRAESFFTLSLDLLCVVGFDGRMQMLNPGWEKTFGFTTEEFQKSRLLEFVHPEDRPAAQEAMARLLAGENVVSVETRFLHRDGSYRWLIWNAAGSTDERMIYLAARDLTSLRQMVDELARSEENFRNSLDDSPLGVRIVTEGGETLYANGKILAIYGYGSLEELLCTPTAARYTKESYALFQARRDDRRRGGDGPSEYAVDIVRKDGEIRNLRVFRKKVRWNGAEQYQAVYQDITERKLALDELRRSDREKALLLKEIHHRVKNNMQIIVSLLRLTARDSGDEKLEEIFRESQNRIRAMAAVHSMLYQSGNFAGINFGAYIRQTAGELFRAYNTSPEKITLLVDAEDVNLPLDAAIPCGLLINELISNALKHAFSKSGSGEIRVEMRKEENGVKITFADNGVGFPERVDFRDTKTLGLKLIQMLVAQLDGQIEMVRDDGTRYVITFKI